MSHPVPHLIERLRDLNVLVLGDAMVDVYLEGDPSRLCREAPVPVVKVGTSTKVPGGAGNAAMNASSLAARVQLVSAVGDDSEGETFRALLEEGGVSTAGLVADPGRTTLALHRVMASSQLLVRFDVGSTSPVGADTEAQVLAHLEEAWPRLDAVIVSDYGYGVLTPGVIGALARHQHRQPLPVLVVDSKHPAAFRHIQPTATKPNWSEAIGLLGSGSLDGVSERADGIAAEGERLLELTGAQILAVTLDSEGAIFFERGRPPHRTYASTAPDSAPIGAGDTFVSALALALAAGADTPTAAEVASAAAAVAVAKPGTATCSSAELRERLSPASKVISHDRLVEVVDVHRRKGRRIVFTNGCFDILHRGHITYLNRAKTLGDVLIVGLNDDHSVRRLKGEGRPINRLEDRAEVLAALSCVDHIAAFSGDSPSDLIEVVRPDLYAKGGDYTVERLPEAPLVEEIGGEVRILPFMEDRSTTGIIERILTTPASGRASPGDYESARR